MFHPAPPISGASTGILVDGTKAIATISGNTGSIYGNAIGIDAEGGSATISGNHIYDNATGIKVGSGTASISGNTFSNTRPSSPNGTDLLVGGDAGTVTIGDGNAFDGSTDYIQNLSSQNFDLSGYSSTTFSGFNAAETTDVADNLLSFYGVEDKIIDALDNASYGYVRIASGYDFVTQASETASPGAIQRGINVATSGDIVEVQAGVYVGELDIEQPLTLRRAQAGVDPNVTPPATGSQTIVEPDTSDPNPYNPNSIVVVNVGSADVTIDGITVDGDNPTLASDPNTVTFNGAAIDAAVGIAVWSGIATAGDITLTNNIVRNTSYTGIDLENWFSASSQPATSNNTVSHNLIQNLGGGGYGYGIGVYVAWNFYADVSSNTIENARVGVQTGAFYLANPGALGTASISGNQISAYRSGIFYNGVQANATPFTVDSNQITAAIDPSSHSTARWTGVLISSQSSNVSAAFDGNTIDGSAAAGYTTTAGYTVWNTSTTGSVSGGSVTGVQYGVWVNSYKGYNSPAGATHATISDVSINASQVGVYVEASPQNTATPAVSATIEDNTSITTGGAGTGILVSGAEARPASPATRSPATPSASTSKAEL